MTLPPRWERFICDNFTLSRRAEARDALVCVLAEHDAELGAIEPLPAEQPAPKVTAVEEYDELCERAAEDAQAAPGGGRLSERMRISPATRYYADEVAALEAKLAEMVALPRPAGPAEQSAPMAMPTDGCTRPCEVSGCDGRDGCYHAQAAPDGGRLSERVHGFADTLTGDSRSAARVLARDVASLEAKLARAEKLYEHADKGWVRTIESLERQETKSEELADKLAAAERDRETALTHASRAERVAEERKTKLAAAERDRDALRDARDVGMVNARSDERARCIAWIQKAEWLIDAFVAIREGRPAP